MFWIYYIIEGTKGWFKWEANASDRIGIDLKDSHYGLNAGLHEVLQGNIPKLGKKGDNFQQSFTSQLRHVIKKRYGVYGL